ncbi:MAG TPA: ABC transporter permease [Trueperaceae bacterium]
MLNVLAANIRKVAIEMRRYLPNTISMIVTFYAIFLMFFWGINALGSPENAGESNQYLIVIMVLWFLSLMAMQGIGWEITQEATRGTLEQLYMSPVPAWRILLARMVGNVLVNLIVIALMLLMAMATAQEWLVFDVPTLVPLVLLTILCMLGVGFMVAGLALVFKHIQALLQIAQFIFAALVTVPVLLTPWFELLPVVRGASMVREAMAEGTSLTGFAASDWLLLLVNALFYFGLGVFLYKLAERRAMNKGLLGQY